MLRDALTVEKLSVLGPREAAAMFIARRAEGLTAHEQQLLEQWLAQDAQNRRQFENAERAWRSFDGSEGDEILAAMRAQAKAPRTESRRRWRWAAAAAVFVAALSGFWLFIPPAETFDFATARGEVKDFQLPDGSTATLDGESSLSGQFSGDQRSLELKRGRALFAVAHDGSRPFTVGAAGRRVVAVGTRFDVNLVGDALSVTLFEGRVNIEAPDGAWAPLPLEPGQQFIERHGKFEVRTPGVGEDVASWREGLVNFDDQPLAEAVAIMNRYSPDQIVIRDSEVASLRVSGQFRAGDSQRFAETLAEMHGLRVVREENRLQLIRKK